MAELTNPIQIRIPNIGTLESKDLYIKSEVDRKLLEKDLALANVRWQYAGMRVLHCPRKTFNFWRKVKNYWRDRAEKIKRQLEEMK